MLTFGVNFFLQRFYEIRAKIISWKSDIKRTRIYLMYFFERCAGWSNWLVTGQNERNFIKI